MRLKIDVELDYHFPEAADVLLALEVAQLPDQILIEDLLTVNGSGPLQPIAGEDGIGRRTWLAAEGPFLARYTATVDVARAPLPLEGLAADAARRAAAGGRPLSLAEPLLRGRQVRGVRREAVRGAGGRRPDRRDERLDPHRNGLCAGLQQHRDDRRRRLRLAPGRLPRLRPSARQLRPRRRHPGAAGLGLCLAAQPPDFHAVVEVWLDGAWQLVDPTGLAPIEGLARIAVGRDATDIAFMTIFGEAQMRSQSVQVTAGWTAGKVDKVDACHRLPAPAEVSEGSAPMERKARTARGAVAQGRA